MIERDGIGRRLLEVERTYNTRDIGGYATRDGRVTRWGSVFRSDGLHDVTPRGREVLVGAGVRAIIDLRSPHELERLPNSLANDTVISYHHLQFIAPRPNIPDDQLKGMADIYATYLEHDGPRIARVFSAIVEINVPLVVHCHAGKDRTGVVMALLLSHLGVPDETIVEDYALSSDLLQPLFPTWLAEIERDGLNVALHERLMRSSAPEMDRTLDLLNRSYGGATTYLRSIGVSESQLGSLAKRLIG